MLRRNERAVELTAGGSGDRLVISGSAVLARLVCEPARGEEEAKETETERKQGQETAGESVTPTDTVDATRPDREGDDLEVALLREVDGGVNGTRTRDLRRDRPAF